ncbi:unnamed protein product [Phaedon cochleariae]|uniref:Equilibrative nucleoside transporter n=1 Tax=Phaedon cochleariae TaxID=80249 RepID=A0A9P0DVS5_PHACE|nr:unnamed protein product [Phaedon cochleariae]
MAEIIQQVEQRTASLLSYRKFSQKQDETIKDVPADRYHSLHLAFFILGMGAMVPMSFFLSANDYWMFKFRDIDKPFDTTVKNTLQKNFQSTSSVISSVSSIITNILSSLFAYKLTLRARFVGSLAVTVTFFIMYTALVEVDTDSWQLGFFILTMGIYFLNNIAGSLFMMSNMAMVSRFPPSYLKSHMYGTSVGILLGSVVQIVCLWIGGSSTQVALMYFLIGTVTCVITLAVAFMVHYIPRFNYYQGDSIADTKKSLPSWDDLREVSKNLWPLILGAFIGSLAMTMSGPAMTALVNSDHHEKGDPWTDKYFVPVLAFLLPGVVGLIGRVLATPLLNRSNVYWWLAVSIINSLAVTPLIMFCNSNKEHLPILFPHDWQFITLQIVISFINSYLSTLSFLSMPKFGGENIELTFLVMATLVGIFMHASSPLSSVWVNIQ